MLFSSTVFLFAFLPAVLTLHLLLRDTRARNVVLLAASLFFYAWGETVYVAVLLASIAANYLFGLWIDGRRDPSSARRALAVAVAVNLALLGVFKYANFVVDNLNDLLGLAGVTPIALAPIHLPIGISFFTFQSITYVVDIYRREAEARTNPLHVGLYIALFPQLIAGPIVRYRRVAEQLVARQPRLDDVASGIRLFVVGLAKKVLVANSLAVPADAIFALRIDQLELPVAWLGLVCFALQIYFDFSGYSDMAIGLGRCFGFDFPENFDWPYSSGSLREFWRRWHISLSTFFRDYVYIPLGGNRLGSARTALHLLAVFLLCGLWHGAAWTFVVWGLIHGAFLALERTRFGSVLAASPAIVARVYVLGVVLLAWVFFRADDLPHALAYLGALVGQGANVPSPWSLPLFLDPVVVLALLVGWATSLRSLRRFVERSASDAGPDFGVVAELGQWATLACLFSLCAMSLAAGTHNPFIYFRF